MEEETGSKKIRNPVKIGDVFGYLTVVEYIYKTIPRGLKYWLCECKCGKKVEILDARIKHGVTRSCGCMRINETLLKDIGKKYGRWTVLKNLGVGLNTTRRYYLCRCDCGTERKVGLDFLRRGESTSCGCYHREVSRSAKHKITHGGSYTDIYKIWRGILFRCFHKTSSSFLRYGARGITVSPEWLGENGFVNFRDHIGPRPSESHSVDRINNDGNYEPGNVRWATPKEQANNRRKSVRRIKNCPLLPLNTFLRVTVYDDPI